MAFLRILSEKGIEEFRIYIQQLKAGAYELPPPVDRLSREPFSVEFDPKIEIDDRIFSTRLELGKYLELLFRTVDRKVLVSQPGMWSWLALFWFNQVCPLRDDGTRKVLEFAKYICSTDYTDYYRHFVALPWDAFRLHGKSVRLLLKCPLNVSNDFVETLASRQNIITMGGLVKSADKLYWKGNGEGGAKRGATNRNKPGNLRRLITIAEQLNLTYDLHTMTADDIIALLPAEFNMWKEI